MFEAAENIVFVGFHARPVGAQPGVARQGDGVFAGGVGDKHCHFLVLAGQNNARKVGHFLALLVEAAEGEDAVFADVAVDNAVEHVFFAPHAVFEGVFALAYADQAAAQGFFRVQAAGNVEAEAHAAALVGGEFAGVLEIGGRFFADEVDGAARLGVGLGQPRRAAHHFDVVVHGQVGGGGGVDFGGVAGAACHVVGDAVFADLVDVKAARQKARLQTGIAHDVDAGGVFHRAFEGGNGFVVELAAGNDAHRLRRVFGGNLHAGGGGHAAGGVAAGVFGSAAFGFAFHMHGFQRVFGRTGFGGRVFGMGGGKAGQRYGKGGGVQFEIKTVFHGILGWGKAAKGRLKTLKRRRRSENQCAYTISH